MSTICDVLKRWKKKGWQSNKNYHFGIQGLVAFDVLLSGKEYESNGNHQICWVFYNRLYIYAKPWGVRGGGGGIKFTLKNKPRKNFRLRRASPDNPNFQKSLGGGLGGDPPSPHPPKNKKRYMQRGTVFFSLSEIVF